MTNVNCSLPRICLRVGVELTFYTTITKQIITTNTHR